ncbi:alpha/beta hydrolase [Sphingomonas sp. NSE70-1]|uniref:Alpha/beta hydrolase n=1 Tax=Sphingomonas caseinilyticus TaxID=2908205 RepID=A0ABT0RTT8_9SPHN|nr:alpha/beta hydrolase [Sphingomonas caseinilyticus]MCL6698407.1 alpha/beta hydrolase [Sphingomonas caseinilyticus]
MRWTLIGALCVIALGGIALGQRERLPAECRQEIVQLCRGAGGGFRQCVRTALPKLSDPCRKAIGARDAAPIAGATEHAFGPDPKQRLDLVKPAGVSRAPVLLFVHGGGWSIGDKRHAAGDKSAWANENGWAFATANYRLVPQATVENQAADVASAIAWLRTNARREGLDPDRIVLMGHSAGAHLVALVGTDPQYLNAAGVPMNAIKGAVLLDGAGYDIAPQANSKLNPVKPMYEAAFGNDPKRQAELSPTLQAAAPNVDRWLILPVASRIDSRNQSNGLADALNRAGASAEVVAVPGENHGSLNKGLGETGDFATEQVDKFLAGAR